MGFNYERPPVTTHEPIESQHAPFQIETREAQRVIPCLQRLIVQSLIHERDYIGEVITDEPLDALLSQGEPYLDRVQDIIKPKGFHGLIVGATVIVSTVDYDEAQSMKIPGKRAYRHGMRMDVYATETTSTARKQAGSFYASLGYATFGRQLINSNRLPDDLLLAKTDFPVKRRFITQPQWDDGSAYAEHLARLRRSKGTDDLTRRSSGKTRRLPKHR